MTGFISGIITALVTPFDEEGVNLAELLEMVDYQIENGADGILILGTTGEASTMTDIEKALVVKTVVKSFKGKIAIIAGTGSNCTKKAVDAGIYACEAGVDGLLAVTPYYNKCTQNGLINYYKAVCGGVKKPVIAYNVPSRTGVNILPETCEKLAEIPNLAGIKEAGNNVSQVVETMRRVRGRLDVFSGEDFLNLPILAIGGAGLISVTSNVAPALMKKMYTLVKENRLDEANAVQDFLLPLEYALFSEVNPIPVKAALNMLGFKAGIPRPPLTELSEENKKILKKELLRTGLKGVC